MPKDDRALHSTKDKKDEPPEITQRLKPTQAWNAISVEADIEGCPLLTLGQIHDVIVRNIGKHKRNFRLAPTRRDGATDELVECRLKSFLAFQRAFHGIGVGSGRLNIFHTANVDIFASHTSKHFMTK